MSLATFCLLYLQEIKPQTSQKQRQKVIELKLLNFTVCEISEETKIHKSIVSRIMFRYESRGTTEHRKNPGRPRCQAPKNLAACFVRPFL